MQVINLDLSDKRIIPLLHAKQGDVGRKFKAILTDGGKAYSVPASAAVSVWYSGASGVGNYTDIGTESAVSVSGNEITVELITQMLTNPGEGIVCLVLSTASGDELGMWNINYCVEPRPGINSVAAQEYYTAFSKAVSELAYPDESLSVSGKAADAAATGAALAGKAPAVESDEYPGCYYRIVNGVLEWINPPIETGVVYKTTERFKGYPVYVTTVNFGDVYETEKSFSVRVPDVTFEYPYFHVVDISAVFMAAESNKEMGGYFDASSHLEYIQVMSGQSPMTIYVQRNSFLGYYGTISNLYVTIKFVYAEIS